MNVGSNYIVTYRWAINRPEWTKTETLTFRGTNGDLAMFQDPDPFNQVSKPFGLTMDRIVELEAA